MPVAAAMVLLVQVVAIFIVARVVMHARCCDMAMVQPVKNMLAVAIAVGGDYCGCKRCR